MIVNYKSLVALFQIGINGWFPVYLPSIGWDSSAARELADEDTVHHGNHGLERIAGGLELVIKFAHHDDVDKIVHAARGVGWCPDYDIEHRDWESAGEQFCQYPVSS